MGAAVSFAQDSIAKAGSKEKRSERTIPVQSSSDFVRERNELLCAPSLQQNSQQLKIDASRGRGCRDSNLNHESLESPFIIHSALSANSTLHTTPVRRSSSSRNHRSGPNSGDSRVYGTRGAIDFLNRRSPMSESASPNENASDDTSAAEVLTQTAMSLGLENDDLIFNLLYFDNGNIPNFGTMLNTMQQETLALHSENNTPYKLNPANEKAISHLIQESYKQTANSDNECAVCKDDIEDEAEITRIPNCKHYFHTECLSRWIQLQAWCPVCRSSLDGDGEADSKSSVVQTLKFDSEEKNSCNCTIFDKSEDISMRVVLMRHNFAHDSAMEIINTGIGRVANPEISCK